jgi:hypothetical protein
MHALLTQHCCTRSMQAMARLCMHPVLRHLGQRCMLSTASWCMQASTAATEVAAPTVQAPQAGVAEQSSCVCHGQSRRALRSSAEASESAPHAASWREHPLNLAMPVLLRHTCSGITYSSQQLKEALSTSTAATRPSSASCCHECFIMTTQSMALCCWVGTRSQ